RPAHQRRQEQARRRRQGQYQQGDGRGQELRLAGRQGRDGAVAECQHLGGGGAGQGPVAGQHGGLEGGLQDRRGHLGLGGRGGQVAQQRRRRQGQAAGGEAA